MVTEVLEAKTKDEQDAKIRQTIAEMLDEVKARGCDVVVLFAAHGDRVMYRYVGSPADVWNIAHMGHDHVMETFKLEAAQPLPGQRVN